MLITMLHSKIHRATVTDCELQYNGSMGIDLDYIDQAGMMVGQAVDVLNINNGKRFTTYLIEEPRGSKKFGVYGAAAHLVDPGDLVIVVAYAQMTPEEAKAYQATMLLMNENNDVGEVIKTNS